MKQYFVLQYFRRLISGLVIILLTHWIGAAQTNNTLRTALDQRVAESAVFQRGFTGFVLFDPESRSFLYNYQGTKYFTPASNTKILTFYAADVLLSQHAPVLHYRSNADTLDIWGAGYPLLLHPDFVAYDTLHQWFQARPEQVWRINNGHFQNPRYGEGWSWDDYPYGYQIEKAALPLYGNAAHFTKDGHLAPIQLQPARLQEQLIYQQHPTVGRDEERNIFTFGERALRAEELDRQVGFRYTPALAEQLLYDVYRRQVFFTQDTLCPAAERQTLYANVPDTVYQQLLQDSDNFLAEQLLLQCSAKRYGYLNTDQIIAYARDTLLAYAPQPFDWVDGSGLSRYNQFSPQSTVMVLDQLYQRLPTERLFRLFPTGGESGTITDWYATPDGAAMVFAKTGTLRHIHCLSGYLRTASGKVYIFSFMHNNFPDKIKLLREEMELVLQWLYERLD